MNEKRIKGFLLKTKIEAAYDASGNTMGWRFLYSPARVLSGARVAFIGLNPGGDAPDRAHPQFAMPTGSAYQHESWAGRPPGTSPLQQQVLALFDRLNVAPENVLTGNLVPFRSPDWSSIHDPAGSLRFGKELWGPVLTRAGPSVVISMGTVVTQVIAESLGVKDLQRHPVGWGAVSARRGDFGRGTLIGLPHLSRFGVMTREASASHLDRLFQGI